MQSRRAVEDAHREIKSPLRGFKWLNRRCAALNRASRGSGGHVGKRGGTCSVASWERGCYAYAVLAKTDVATTPGIPGYATIGLCQDATPSVVAVRVDGRGATHHDGLSRRCVALNVDARRFSRSPARDERPPPRDRISPTGGTRSVASVRGNPNGTFHPPTRRPRRLPPCNLAKTDCGVARYSGRRSHIGLCQIRVCAASAFPRRTRRSASLTFPSADATSASLPYPHEPRPARSTI